MEKSSLPNGSWKALNGFSDYWQSQLKKKKKNSIDFFLQQNFSSKTQKSHFKVIHSFFSALIGESVRRTFLPPSGSKSRVARFFSVQHTKNFTK
jgi:cephalosporin-C deacetylase-like acetyl esterase